MAQARTHRHAAAIAGLTAALIALTCAYSWPLVLHAATRVPRDTGDPLLVTWILWWSTQAVPLTTTWWNAPAFYPAAGVFAFSETLLGLAPIAAPIIALFHAPIAAYNAAFLASFVLSGLGGYVLGIVLTGRRAAAAVAAIAFAFAPYRLSHLEHLQLLSSYWMPVSIAALHLYDRAPRQRWAALFAGAWLIQALACGYYFFFLSLLAAGWLAWFAPRRWTKRMCVVLAAWWIGAAILLAPLFAGYQRIQSAYGFKRVPSEIAYYSADIAGLATASSDSLLWHDLRAVGKSESELFPGITIVALVAGAAAMRRRWNATHAERAPLAFYLAAAGVCWLLALGPRPAFRGVSLGLPGPYAVLMLLPGFSGVRVPARLWMDAVLCLSAAAAIVVGRIEHVRPRRAVAALAIVGFLADGWPGAFTTVAVPRLRPRLSAAVARLGLPLAGNETESMYQSMGDGLPVFNGYSGYDAPQHWAMRDLLERHDPDILRRLAVDGPIEVTVEHALDPDGGWRRYVAATAGARTISANADWTAFLVPQSDPLPPPDIRGRVLGGVHVTANVNNADAPAMVDGNLVTRWHAPEQSGSETVTVDIGAARLVNGLLLCLGTYASQYPRALAVDVSLDGRTWTSAWTGRTALAAYDAALEDPREIPIAVPLARTTRFIRLRQTAREATRGWTIVELKVIG